MSAEKAGLPGSHPVTMPTRQFSTSSAMSDDAIPVDDPKNTSELLAERLQAWKHAVGYLEAYVSATEKVQKAHAKEYEKVLKTIADPLKEGHHFDQNLGGIASLFENMRTNTQGLANTHLETEKNIKGSVLPILDRLHKEIKNKSKELSSGAGKSAKEVDKARNVTQKHIELLGQNTASFASSGGKITANDDPYVVQRGVYHRLGKQVIEENNNKHDLVNVQNNFAQFESHIIEVIQQALMTFNQFVGGQAQKAEQLYGEILGTAQAIPLNFEWTGFVERNSNILFNVKGKDVSKGIGGKLTGTSELQFKAHTASDAVKWYEAIRSVAGAGPASSDPMSPMTSAAPVSPVDKHASQPPVYAENTVPAALQTTGIAGGEIVTSPTATSPVNAGAVANKI
ncbi:hypothetical protein BUE80_DR011147 [Diplocarpon rosae]|nr:hypothetical protein BUE80_DR011147 [Diplocarpon rosae]